MANHQKSIRTRFAPSPTGFLHVGGARTALFCWLYARRHKGQFILRVEDTDLERSTEASINAILEGMAWLGLDYDEGPFYQTERFDRYREVIQKLLDDGFAYRCYCSKVRLQALRDKQVENKEKPRYDGHCRELTESYPDQPHVIRFKNPKQGAIVFDDLIRGTVTVQNSELDDLIIARTDGSPTYNFTVVVDDWDMKITHVIRGNDHLNNTPRQINILKALGAELPHYAHVPMILGHDGKRLSKRHGAVSLLQYREAGVLAQAMRNYLVRLGWSHKDQEIFSLEEMIALFDFDSVNRSPAAFNNEKLLWLNAHYLKTKAPSDVAKPLADMFDQLGITKEQGPKLEDIVSIQAERTKTLKEMAERSRYFYEDFSEYDEKAARKHLKPEIKSALSEVRDKIAALADWKMKALHQIIIDVAEAQQLKLGKIAQPIRVAVTGNTISPPIDATLFYIGRDRVLSRLDKAIHFIGS